MSTAASVSIRRYTLFGESWVSTHRRYWCCRTAFRWQRFSLATKEIYGADCPSKISRALKSFVGRVRRFTARMPIPAWSTSLPAPLPTCRGRASAYVEDRFARGTPGCNTEASWARSMSRPSCALDEPTASSAQSMPMPNPVTMPSSAQMQALHRVIPTISSRRSTAASTCRMVNGVGVQATNCELTWAPASVSHPRSIR